MSKFMIMCCKQRTGTDFIRVTNILTDSPGNTQSIISTCTSPHLIKDYEALFRGIIYNICDLIHLYHKSTLTSCKIITSTNSGKNTIDKTYLGSMSRDKTT